MPFPMNNSKILSIVMPCLNEAKALKYVIREIPVAELKEMRIDIEILLVDGGSHDGSREIAVNEGVRILTCPRGYGRQCRYGYQHAKGDIILTVDSDGTYILSDALKLVETIVHNQMDFVHINRFANIIPGAMSLTRKTGNIILTTITNRLFNLDLRDSQSGMWAFKKEVLNKIILTGNGMPFSQEIKIEAFKKLKALEIPGSYRPRIGNGKLRPIRDGWQNTVFLFNKRLKELFLKNGKTVFYDI